MTTASTSIPSHLCSEVRTEYVDGLTRVTSGGGLVHSNGTRGSFNPPSLSPRHIRAEVHKVRQYPHALVPLSAGERGRVYVWTPASRIYTSRSVSVISSA
eukprot:RCo047666